MLDARRHDGVLGSEESGLERLPPARRRHLKTSNRATAFPLTATSAVRWGMSGLGGLETLLKRLKRKQRSLADSVGNRSNRPFGAVRNWPWERAGSAIKRSSAEDVGCLKPAEP